MGGGLYRGVTPPNPVPLRCWLRRRFLEAPGLAGALLAKEGAVGAKAPLPGNCSPVWLEQACPPLPCRRAGAGQSGLPQTDRAVCLCCIPTMCLPSLCQTQTRSVRQQVVRPSLSGRVPASCTWPNCLTSLRPPLPLCKSVYSSWQYKHSINGSYDYYYNFHTLFSLPTSPFCAWQTPTQTSRPRLQCPLLQEVLLGPQARFLLFSWVPPAQRSCPLISRTWSSWVGFPKEDFC